MAEAPGGGAAVRGHGARRRFAEAFSPTHNSLNFLRLALALTVVAGHAIDCGFGTDVIFSYKTTIGTVAVFGFFGLSGYLICASAARNSLGRYLWQRCLRIFPAFWVCLAVTAVFFGAIGFFAAPHPAGCGLTCYLDHRGLPYVTHNFLLRITRTSLGHGNVINDDPLWTLFYEFVCYLALGALAVTGLLRQRYLVLALAVGLWTTEIVIASRPHLFFNFDQITLLMLGPVFLTGTVIRLFQDRLPDSGLLALACSALFFVGIWLPFGGATVAERPTSIDLLAPLVAYPLLWLGTHLPLQRVGARNDYSYGIYIYGAPVLTLLYVWHAEHWGYVPFLLAGTAMTSAFAAASWWLVERHALRLKGLTVGGMTRSSRPVAGEQALPGDALPSLVVPESPG